MCGITGIYIFRDEGLPFIQGVEQAVQALHKRGPDSSGTYLQPRVALGHARLSVIDVSDAASQPFTDSTGRYTIVFNGEFYNYREHRENLLAKGISFRSNSDTEVLLNLFIIEGASCLEKVNGFFAFAIYDKEEQTLFIARDRMGVKPLYIYKDHHKFIFASEIKALLAYGIPKEFDHASLFEYLQFNYVPAPHSMFRNIKKLMPGTYLIVQNGKTIATNYYNIPYKTDDEIGKNKMGYDEAQRKISRLLEDSVQLRLVSDVPLGAFLSGGIDSSVIVALASKFTNRLNTFSIGYKDEPFFDETTYAQALAEKFKANHTTFSLSNDDLFSVLFDVLDYTDEPYADSSALAVFILSKLTRQHVTVALSGDGADELFGGYNKHRAEYRIRNAGITEKTIGLLNPLWFALPQSRNDSFSNKIRQFAKFSQGMKLTANERYWKWCAFATEREIEDLLHFKPGKEYRDRKAYLMKNVTVTGSLNEILFADMQMVLVNDMLVKVDMMSMANSLEVRTPFLDYTLVNYVFSLPTDYKVNQHTGKKILQDTFREMLPGMIYNRPKHGFEVPLLKWFRKELNSFIFDDMLNERFVLEQGLFDLDVIKSLKTKLFSNNPGDAAARIWGLVVFQYWWKKYFSV